MVKSCLSKPLFAVFACACALTVVAGCAAPASSGASSASSSSASATSTSASSASTASATSASAQSSASSAALLTAEGAVAQGYQVFSGTVRVVSPEELIKLQGVDIDPAAASGGGTYAVLVFDQPTNVVGMMADGSGEDTRASKMLGIAEHTDFKSFVVEYGDLDMWKGLDGQRVTLVAKAKNIMFPSDVRLPIGEPSASEVILLS